MFEKNCSGRFYRVEYMGSGAFEGAWKRGCFYTGIPETDEEIVNRIGDADCVLVSYNTQIRRNVIEACPNIKYIGMCCTLYSESSANVDIAAARERG